MVFGVAAQADVPVIRHGAYSMKIDTPFPYISQSGGEADKLKLNQIILQYNINIVG